MSIKLSVNGVDRSNQFDNFTWSVTDNINEQPNTARFECFGFEPLQDEAVIIGENTLTGADRLFRGRVTDVAILHGKLNDGRQLYAVQAVDNTAALDRQLYTKRWSATSATTIVQDIIDNFTTGFTRTNVQAALPTVTTEFKMQYPSEALTQIARLIGAYWYLDEDLDLHFFLTEVSSTPDDLDANNLDFSKFQYGENGDQIRNRILVEGLGTFVTVPRVAGDTTIPVESATAFASSSTNKAIVGNQIVTYTGKQAGGTGSTVNGAQHTPSAPGAPAATLKSPKESGRLAAGVNYRYKITFANDDAETAGGTATSDVTPTAVAAPVGVMSSHSPTTGGSMALGEYYYVMTYVTAEGETTESPVDGPRTVTVGNNALTLSGLATSGDARVTGRRVYRSGVASGSNFVPFLLVKVLNDNSTTSFTDTLADASRGSSTPPAKSTATDGEKVSLTSIPVSADARVTKRHIYRSEDAGSTYKRVGSINDNATTTFTDNAGTGGNTLGTGATNWAVPIGGTSIGVNDLAQFPASGWVRAGSQVIRYTGRSSSSGVGTLTGVPASATGAIVAAIPAQSPVVVEPHLTGVPSSSTGSIAYDIAAGDEIHLLVERNNSTSEGAYGSRQLFIQDRRLSIVGAEDRGDAELEVRKDPLIRGSYETTDPLTRSGKTITVDMPTWGLSFDATIMRVEIFMEPGRPSPTRRVEYANRIDTQNLYTILRRLQRESDTAA